MISNTVEPRYNAVLEGPWNMLLSGVPLYQGKKQRNIKSWDQQNYLL